jgi:hypothetical protein
MEITMSKQDEIFKMISTGEHTKDEIIKQVKCTANAFASYCSSFMNGAKFSGAAIAPIEIDNKMVFKTYEEVQALRPSAGTAKAKDPISVYNKLRSRIDRLSKSVAKIEALKKADRSPEQLLQLAADKAALALAVFQKDELEPEYEKASQELAEQAEMFVGDDQTEDTELL